MGMDTVIKELKSQAGFSSTFEDERINQLVKLVLARAKMAVSMADTKNIILTTHDQDLVVSTIVAVNKSLDYYFGDCNVRI